MIKHYIKIAFRNLRKNIFYTLISLIGLVISMGAFVILMNYVDFESHYDDFHKDSDKIYRAESYFTLNGTVADSWATSSFGYAGAMKAEFSEVKAITRIHFKDNERIVRYQDKIYRERMVVIADSNFLSFFSFPLLKGDPHKVLLEPNTIAISASAAKKYFGDADPIGKVLDITTRKVVYHCAVSGVFEDFPPQSHLKLDMIISYASTSQFERDFWYMHSAYTYVKTDSEADARMIEKKFPALAEKFKTEDTMRDKRWEIHMVPLADIHLNPLKPMEFELKGSKQNVRFIFVFALIILIVGWVNFINIMTSKSIERAGEIGLRKLVGSKTKHMMIQFFIASFIINFLAVSIFLILMVIALPFLTHLYYSPMFSQFWQRPMVWGLLVLIFLLSTLITGAVPILVLRNIKIAVVLKNRMSFRVGMGKGLRHGLIIFQFTAAIVLVVSTVTIKRQMDYMQGKDLGADVAQTLVFKTPAKTDNYEEKLEMITEKMKTIGGVKSVSRSSAVPGEMVDFFIANQRDNDPEKVSVLTEMFRVDYDFIDAYQLKIVKGRNFSKTFGADKDNSLILTQSAMKIFGFKNEEEAVGGFINLEGQGKKKYQVIGVLKDYHHLSLKENFRPVVFLMFSPWNLLDFQYVSVKVQGANAKAIAGMLEQEYKSVFPDSSFDSFFLDEFFNRQYKEDVTYGLIIMIFTWLTIFIVCLGILGIASLMLLRRTKEIAIRKISGAKPWQILKLINMEFIRWVGLAIVIGTPLSWWIMHNWLENFPYRTEVEWWIFVLAGLLTVLVTGITVSIQTVKSALENPVKSLRNE